MIVVGGVYRELCARPRWSRIFGSGTRAVTTIAALSPDSELHAYASADWVPGLQASGAATGYRVALVPIHQKITWEYLHPMSRPQLFPPNIDEHDPITVSGEAVLRFGFVEGDAIVHGKRVVYDPQTGDEPDPFFKNGSTCETLAIVLNAKEAFLASGLEATEAGQWLLEKWGAAVVVIKLGTQGALVFEGGGEPEIVRPFHSSRVFKIGSGDVFSAVFAHCWAERKMIPSAAATHASAAVAQYVESRSLPLATLPTAVGRRQWPVKSAPPYIYLAAPFFDVSQRWMVEESLSLLQGLGADVFSPIHHVGLAVNVPDAASRDLAELKKVDAVLALIDSKDPGTIFEIGYARALPKPRPVIVLAERLRPEDLTMLIGSDCYVTDDFTTALYQAFWAAA